MTAHETLEQTQREPNQDAPGPEPIFKAVAGFYTANYLAAANAIGLFDALAAGPMDLAALSEATGAGSYRTRMVADAMVATGFLTKDDGAYSNTGTSHAFLSGQGPMDMRPWITMWERVSFPRWAGFSQAVRDGEATPTELTEEEQQIFSAGVEVITAPTAQALAKGVDWSGRKRVLDIGGGTGSMLRAILSQDEHLQGTLFDLPDVAKIAESKLRGLEDRVDVVAGDLFQDPLPGGHDVMLMANVAHLWQPEKSREVLARVADAADPGTRLLLADFWTDADKVDPPMAALASGDFLLATGEGQAYSVDEAAAWLDDAGFDYVEHRPLAGPQSLIVAEVR